MIAGSIAGPPLLLLPAPDALSDAPISSNSALKLATELLLWDELLERRCCACIVHRFCPQGFVLEPAETWSGWKTRCCC